MKASSAILAAAAMLATVVATAAERDLSRRALEQMQAGRYEKAVGLLERHLDSHPNDARAFYNLACGHSQLGDQGEAAEALEAAWQAGLRDIDLIRSDPDLEALRGTKRGRRLVERLVEEEAERQRRRGQPLLFDAGVVASARVVVPESLEEGARLPLVVALHGNGGSPEPLAGMFLAAGLSPDFVVLAPYGPYTVQLPGGFGYSWYPPLWLFREELARRGVEPGRRDDPRRQELERREESVSEAYVLAAIDATLREHPVDPERVFVLGHSQGGALAYGLALSHPDRVRGLIAVAAPQRGVALDAERLAAAAGRLEVLVCHSPDDAQIAFSEGRSAHERLEAAGIDSRFVRYEGGHGVNLRLVRKIAGWIEKKSAD